MQKYQLIHTIHYNKFHESEFLAASFHGAETSESTEDAEGKAS